MGSFCILRLKIASWHRLDFCVFRQYKKHKRNPSNFYQQPGDYDKKIVKKSQGCSCSCRIHNNCRYTCKLSIPGAISGEYSESRTEPRTKSCKKTKQKLIARICRKAHGHIQVMEFKHSRRFWNGELNISIIQNNCLVRQVPT